MKATLVFLAVLAVATATVHFEEKFDDDYESRWTFSTAKVGQNAQGKWSHDHGEWYGDEDEDMGLKTSEDYRFYGAVSKIKKPFSNKGKDLVLQYSVKHTQKLDCGGAYIKLTPSKIKAEKFDGDAPYHIMFGPDMCGHQKRTHLIFNYKGNNLLKKVDMRMESDQLTHVYTMILHPDNTYEVQIDLNKVASGKLDEDWDFLAPKMIKDPNESKPSDWVDEAKIPDPEDTKPEDWDDIPEEIADPDAEMPDDWDEESDGEWTAPMIPNPDYKGEWSPRMIDNPDYKGEWVHPMIENPDYEYDDEMYLYNDVAYVGFELWQVKAGTIFDNILVTDDVDYARELAESTWQKNKSAEKAMFDDAEKAKSADAAPPAPEPEESHDDDEDEDEDEDDDDDEKDEL